MGEYVDFHDEFKNITNEKYLEKKEKKQYLHKTDTQS